jgi:hypothetical protein
VLSRDVLGWALALHKVSGEDRADCEGDASGARLEMEDPRARDPRRPPFEIASSQRLLAFLVAGGALAGLIALLSVQCAMGPQHARAYPSRSLPPEPRQRMLLAEGPSEDYFPCSDCHEDEPTNREVRELEDDHEDIELAHGDLWCLHCHDADDRDRLHLADATPIGFEESWKLCVQCHGNKLADWRAGVHGKRVGHWWGEREVWTCVSCHGPHAPRFQALEPKRPPRPPREIALRARERSEEDSRE